MEAVVTEYILSILDVVHESHDEQRLRHVQAARHQVAKHQVEEVPFVAGDYGSDEYVLAGLLFLLIPDTDQLIVLYVDFVLVSQLTVVLVLELAFPPCDMD